MEKERYHRGKTAPARTANNSLSNKTQWAFGVVIFVILMVVTLSRSNFTLGRLSSGEGFENSDEVIRLWIAEFLTPKTVPLTPNTEAAFELEKALEFQRAGVGSEERLEKPKKSDGSVKERNSGQELGSFTKAQSKDKKRSAGDRPLKMAPNETKKTTLHETSAERIEESANGTNQWELAVAALEKAREKNGETVVAAMENPNAKEFNSIDSFHEETIVRELNPEPIRKAELELDKSNIPILESNHKLIHSDTTANLNQELIQEIGNTRTIPIEEKANGTNQWELAIAADNLAADAEISFSESNYDFRLSDRVNKSQIELDKANIQILELSNPESIQETANWEWAEDSYRIRLQENVNIERWAWENIQKKQNELHRGGNIRNHPPCLVANETARLLYPPSREEQRKNKDRKKQNVTRMFQRENRNRPELHQNFIIFQSPRTDRKLMHYYAIRMNGPPPTIHKQV